MKHQIKAIWKQAVNKNEYDYAEGLFKSEEAANEWAEENKKTICDFSTFPAEIYWRQVDKKKLKKEKSHFKKHTNKQLKEKAAALKNEQAKLGKSLKVSRFKLLDNEVQLFQISRELKSRG